MKTSANIEPISVSFVGSAGIPNKYGGFEAFLEHCAPEIARLVTRVIVTCDSSMYSEKDSNFNGVERVFIKVPANGAWSVLHDLIAFFSVFLVSTHIIVLGVSGGPWFPLFRFLCSLTGKTLLINVDGVEWQRSKFSRWKRVVLRLFDYLSQTFSHVVIYDNPALQAFLIKASYRKSKMIPYSGDHVRRFPNESSDGCALTICRIEPENNIQMLIEGFLNSSLKSYVFIGNWNNSLYGRTLRDQYINNTRLELLDPIYDSNKLAIVRENCSVYIHGHSVGGTNPSLVEMLFYDCRIVCLDIAFHHQTAGNVAEYFKCSNELARLLDSPSVVSADRDTYRSRYTRFNIAKDYVSAMNNRALG